MSYSSMCSGVILILRSSESLFVIVILVSRLYFALFLSGIGFMLPKRGRFYSVLPFRLLFFRATASSFISRNMTTERQANQLVHAMSPYLRQHCYNPVHWMSWGDEAFQKAKQQNKLIFLSVGYSTCHWCHVMERESFENKEIADILNDHYVSIKVDREERPDVDRLYMTFIQGITGGGGWPMSVFLTPDLEPVVGGTYFPPEDAYGRPGFKTLLRLLSERWREDETVVRNKGEAMANALRDLAMPDQECPNALSGVSHKCYEYFESQFDKEYGGFGTAPKFPKPVDLDFLMNYYFIGDMHNCNDSSIRMVGKTLEAMADGGIHDHIGKGFHRYSVDAKWHVPHFEKMLYDQAQLMITYSNYAILTNRLKETVRDIVEYCKNTLSHEEGGFYSAEDADSQPTVDCPQKSEGAFYVWKYSDIDEILNSLNVDGAGESSPKRIFMDYFSLREGGNISSEADPHHELTGKNILTIRHRRSDMEKRYSLSSEVLNEIVNKGKELLNSERNKRPRPQIDDKIIASWNGLMISGLARATIALNDENCCKRAEMVVHFIRRYMYSEERGLIHSVYRGSNGGITQLPNPIAAFASDYSFVIQGVLDLYQCTFDDVYLRFAVKLQDDMDKRFWNTENNNGYYLNQHDPSLLHRIVEYEDGAEPCANSVAALNLLRLSDILSRREYRAQCEKILRGASFRLDQHPYSISKMVIASQNFEETPKQVIVIGSRRSELVRKFIEFFNDRFLPNYCVLSLDKEKDSWLLSQNEHLRILCESAEEPSVHVCENFTCKLPLTTIDSLKEEFGEKGHFPMLEEVSRVFCR